jgi:glycosyltransferase involved in cell wall biosynthesis
VSSAPASDVSPRITLVLFLEEDDPALVREMLASLSCDAQRGVAATDYEILVVGTSERLAALAGALPETGVSTRLEPAPAGAPLVPSGVRAARGEAVALLGRAGIASPCLLSTLSAALDAHGASAIVVPTFELDVDRAKNIDEWLAASGYRSDRHALVELATAPKVGTPPYRWLDPVARIDTVVLSREAAQHALDLRAAADVDAIGRTGRRVQLVGEAFVRPVRPGTRERPQAGVDPDLVFFGRVHYPGTEPPARPTRFARRDRPFLSVVVIVHDMRREAPRTLRSLLPGYQEDVSPGDYELVVVDNGSREPLSDAEVQAAAPGASYHVLTDAPGSPARAINHGVRASRGEALAIVIDGACLLSPGVLRGGLAQWRAFPRPVVLTRYFMLGPGMQRHTLRQGYDRDEEDRLLASIAWPEAGYRLFEIASPLTFGGSNEHWLRGWFESNCLFVPRSVFDELGGFDERFDLPGGGALNIDFFLRACALPGTEAVQLLGEGVFHQVHGGITTNATPDDFDEKVEIYRNQYVAIRGEPPRRISKSYYFDGALRNAATRWKMDG